MTRLRGGVAVCLMLLIWGAASLVLADTWSEVTDKSLSILRGSALDFSSMGPEGEAGQIPHLLHAQHN